MKLFNSFPFRIFILALILRLIPVLMSYNLGIGLDDMFQYDMLARSLVAGDGYRWYAEDDLQLILPYLELDVSQVDYEPIGIRASHRAPMYPFFLAAIYLIGGLGKRFFITRLVQAAIMAGLAPITYDLAGRLFPKNDRVGIISAWVIALYPFYIVLPLALATENIFIPLVTGALVLMLKAGESRQWRDWLLAGVLLGLAALTRSVVIVFLPFAMLWAWHWVKDRKGALLLPMVVLALTIPWAVRNTLLHEQLTFVETGLGYNMYLGYHPEGTGSFEFGISLDLLTILDDAERHQIGMAKALEFVQADPGRVPALMVHKLGRFFGLERRAITYFYANNFVGPLPLLVLLGIFGVYLLPFVYISSQSAFGLLFIRWEKELMLIGFFVLSYLIPHVVILAEPRFHLTIIPILAALAGYVWVTREAITAQMRLPNNRWKVILSITLVGLLAFNWGWELYQDIDKLSLLFGPDGNNARFPY